MSFAKKNKAILLAVVMSASALLNIVFADNGDVYNKDGTLFAKAAKATLDVGTRARIGIAPEKFFYEFRGKYYSQSYIDRLFSEALDKSAFTEKINTTEGKDKIINDVEPQDGDLEVEDIL